MTLSLRLWRRWLCAVVATLCASTALASELIWAGKRWEVRAGQGKPCATSIWNERGAWVDADGWLHLKLARVQQGRFACVEVASVERFGFGRYAFEVRGPVGSLDRNVVFGVFLYPPADVGPDGTNEIDMEISRWGDVSASQINYTVWNRSHIGKSHETESSAANVTQAQFSLVWQRDVVRWESSLHRGKYVTFVGDIAAQPQKLMINLWLFKAPMPSDGREVEFAIRPSGAL